MFGVTKRNLKREIEIKDIAIEELKATNKKLVEQLKGGHVTGGHCSLCINGYSDVWGPKCKLDIKCKDFKDKSIKNENKCTINGPCVVI